MELVEAVMWDSLGDMVLRSQITKYICSLTFQIY